MALWKSTDAKGVIRYVDCASRGGVKVYLSSLGHPAPFQVKLADEFDTATALFLANGGKPLVAEFEPPNMAFRREQRDGSAYKKDRK